MRRDASRARPPPGFAPLTRRGLVALRDVGYRYTRLRPPRPFSAGVTTSGQRAELGAHDRHPKGKGT